MAETTTARNACNASLWLDDSGGTLLDISGSSNSFDPSFTREIGDYQVFQQCWKKRLACGLDGSFTLNVVYSTTAAEAFQLLNAWLFEGCLATFRTLTWFMPDKNVGSNMWSAEVLLADFGWTEDPTDAGPVIATVTLVPNGEVTHSVLGT